jgi:hypothetical protein
MNRKRRKEKGKNYIRETKEDTVKEIKREK